MNEAERTELVRLKEHQTRLENELRLLAQQLTSFEQRLVHSAPDTTAKPQAEPVPSHQPIRVELPKASTSAPVVPAPPVISIPPRPTVLTGTPETRPPVQEFAQQTAAVGGDQPIPVPPPVAAAARLRLQAQPPPPPAPPLSQSVSRPPLPPPTWTSQPPQAKSFEMRLGTYWLVRIGIVMVLTGLVFFGNLAYHNYISKLGAGGKVAMLYLASGLLLGAGWWWQRRTAKDALRNYAQVLFAGGLGALYFTTYAAHYLDPLRVINSALLDGVLLLGCAGFMIWAAERKRSEVLAFFAVGLAYYTSIITRVGYFTLWSNLVLSAASVVFLVRNRWAALSFGSLIATYAAYSFWRFFDGSDWHWASPEQGLWSGTLFLMLYWFVFTSAVFLSRDQKFAGQNRITFLTLNNGAFFTLFLLTMLQVHQGGFWRFSLTYGAVLVGLSVLAARLLKDEPHASNMYLTQGLLLVTLGFIFKFAGLQLSLVLGLESVLLLIIGQQRKNLILFTGAYLASVLSVGWAMDVMRQFDPAGLWLGIGIGLLMTVNGFLEHRRLPLRAQASAGPAAAVLRPQPSYFAV